MPLSKELAEQVIDLMARKPPVGVKVSVTRYAGSSQNPGLVECRLQDVRGRQYTFIVPATVLGRPELDPQSAYPQSALLASEVVGDGGDGRREWIAICTQRPTAFGHWSGSIGSPSPPRQSLKLPSFGSVPASVTTAVRVKTLPEVRASWAEIGRWEELIPAESIAQRAATE